MTISQSNTKTAQPHFQRRAACDRCRAQKLRCVQDTPGTSAKCKRCAAAGTTCNFGIPKPAGRPSANRTWTDRSHDDEATRRKTPMRASSSSQTDFLDDNLAQGTRNTDDGDHSGATRTDETIAPPWSAEWSQSHISSVNPLFDEANLLSISQGGGDLIGLDGPNPSTPWSLPLNHSPQMEFPWESLPSINNNTDTQDLPCSTAGPDSAFIPSSIQTAPETEHDIDQHATIAKSPRKHLEPQDAVSDSRSDYEVIIERKKPEIGGLSQQDCWMQKLSQISMDLYELSTTSDELHREIEETGWLEHFPHQMAGRLTELSTAFLELLQYFQQSNDDHRQAIKNSSSHSISIFSSNNSSSDLSDNEAVPIIENVPPNLRRKPKSQPRPDLPWMNMTTGLQLVACYLRFHQLHSVLYTAIYNYIAVDQSDRTMLDIRSRNSSRSDQVQRLNFLGNRPTIFLGLQIGGVSLEPFHNFQIKLVLQINTHLFGEIERALGLPDGYRVSKKRKDEGSGILGGSMSPRLVEMTMRDYASGDVETELDTLSTTKKRLAALRGLLKGTIDI
ncbi:Zn(II)2Cys6 transcription factor domain-containing protein [Aspergillus ruber CBS 135680]|uniref:Zn(2)-C6 fungal-type domain-containing protein n=1 Tax=Aspergillus ruber (strain CBS 135680) TaxID=1388766 RepID=A0A017S421_ASPRC|nr:uncharacterized protein EURHEDRAFT_405835 [Aspergillus ruber CBS 135680]EYE91697.1 hypothetical protein EURHEDRAFT_405835 [Aspergillus ruber CBS 135680]